MNTQSNNFTLDDLKTCMDYNPSTGIFTWIKKTNRRVVVGAPAGTSSSSRKGRVVIYLNKTRCFASRLAWLYVHGVWPTGQIDHIDGNPANDRISNLRDVSPLGNSQNIRKANSRSSSGLLGATKSKRDKWTSHIKVNGRALYLGRFDTPEEAHLAYVEAKRVYHPTCSI